MDHDIGTSNEVAPGRPGASFDALALLESRRSVPLPMLGEPGPSAADLRRMLAVAVRVPDHGGLEPWRFVVIEGDARARAGALLAPVYAAENEAMEPDKRDKFTAIVARVLTQAPLVVVVVSTTDPKARIPAWEQDLSAGAVCMNLLHAAHALGYAGSWLTGWAANSAGAHAVLGVSAAEKVAGILYLGTAVDRPADRKRPDADGLVTRWSEPAAR